MDVTIDEEIIVNQISQCIIDWQAGLDWFRTMPSERKHSVLRDLGFMAYQAGFGTEDVSEACKKTGLNERFTPCVLMAKGIPKVQLAKIINLPTQEYDKVFLLLVGLLSVGDARRRSTKCAAGCTHWWHRDLTDAEILRKIANGEII
jgi:hypothetical protein